MSVDPLEWDTAFFGVPIGRATSDAPLDTVASDAKQAGLACVYVESQRELEPGQLDLRLVDKRVVLRAILHATADKTHEVRRASPSDAASLGPALDRLATWSRFARDVGFGVDAARRMYARWLDRALASSDEVVGIIDGETTGFVSVQTGPRAQIGIIATSADGSGAGRTLVSWALSTAQPASSLDVVTQGDNTRALGLYEQNGFVRVSETFMYHLWIGAYD